MTDKKSRRPNGDDRTTSGITIDWELYACYLEESDLTDEEKRAFIETLWSIMVSFVDLGFRISPVQEICGEIKPLEALCSKQAPDVLDSKNSKSQKAFKKAAGESPDLSRERSPK